MPESLSAKQTAEGGRDFANQFSRLDSTSAGWPNELVAQSSPSRAAILSQDFVGVARIAAGIVASDNQPVIRHQDGLHRRLAVALLDDRRAPA